MKSRIVKIALTAITLLIAASVSFAIEVKTPDPKGDAKATADKTKTDAKADAAKTKADAKGTTDKVKSDVKAKIIDINTATEAELKAIPGIGDTYAAKIIAGRPYANKTQLKTRNILPSVVYEKTKDLIIAKQSKK
jgi:DNA uptake protein ComE-like DNA-binding protein